MAAIGAELSTPSFGRRWGAAAKVAASSVVLPLLLGTGLATVLYKGYAPDGVGFTPFVAFIAVSVSITALPVMARILKDRGLVDTAAGKLAISAAVLADVVA